MKTVFMSFQGVDTNSIPKGMVRILLPIFKEFLSYSEKKYLLGFDLSDSKDKELKKVAVFYQHFQTWLPRFGRLLRLNTGFIRLMNEVVYDYLASLHLTEPCYLISSAYNYRTAKRNKKLGGINILIAGNPYDRHIANILNADSLKFGIVVSDPYTFEPRLRFIDKSIELQDYIVAQTVVTFNSFKPYFSDKNMSVSNYNLKPPVSEFPEVSSKKDSKFTFVYVAHTVWLKGLQYLIEAWNNLELEGTTLVIAGSIDRPVEAYINKFPNLKIDFVGPVVGKELNNLFRTCDVCIVPSLLDDHPATICESLMLGLPVIATDGCGSGNLIKDGYNGFIIPAADSCSLGQKIKWFLENKDQIHIMSENARDSFNEVLNSNQDARFAQHLHQLIQNSVPDVSK
jgi:glycosyltransferase involved in cell wall biosynthesis